MTNGNPTGGKRPNRNTLWLIGVGVAAIIVGVLAANSRMAEGESAGHDYTSTQAATPPPGLGATEGGQGPG